MRPQLPIGTLVRFVGHRDPAEWLCGSAITIDWDALKGRVGTIRAYRFVMPSIAAGRFRHGESHLYDVLFTPTVPLGMVLCCDREIEPLD